YTAMGYSQYLDGKFADYPLWVANYGVKCPVLPRGWRSWVFWQHAGNEGRATGVKGAVDLNVFRGTLEDLQAFVRTASLPAQETQAEEPPPSPPAGGRCPPEMTLAGSACVDRWEAATVEILPNGKERPHSPFVPVVGSKVRAVSAAGAVPQGYINYAEARDACG